MIAWIDLETTGLDPAVDCILEVACVITTDKLVEVEARSAVVPWPPKILKGLRAQADPIVQRMHDESGLWAECSDPRFASQSEALVAQGFVDWIGWAKDFAAANAKLAMGGSSVHFDRAFLRARMRNLHDIFSHHNLDVSVLRDLAWRWNPAVFAARPKGDSTKGAKHRALDDARASIESLRHYRDHFLVCAGK